MTFRDGLGRVIGAVETAFYAFGDALTILIRVLVAIGAFVRAVFLLLICVAVLSGLGGIAYLAWGHPERIGVAIGIIAIPLMLRFMLAGFTSNRRSSLSADNSVLESRSNPASINFSGKR